MIYYFLKGCLFGILIFLIYLEFNPKLGNIFIRKTEYGYKKLNLNGLKLYFLYPFRNTLFWNIHFLDLNWIIYATLFGVINIIFKKLLKFSGLIKVYCIHYFIL